MRYLVKCKVFYDHGAWTINSNKGGTRVFRGSAEDFGKFLRKIKAKDDVEDPRSFRSMTYLDMANEIMSGKDNIIYVWSNNWPNKGKVMSVIEGEF